MSRTRANACVCVRGGGQEGEYIYIYIWAHMSMRPQAPEPMPQRAARSTWHHHGHPNWGKKTWMYDSFSVVLKTYTWVDRTR